ncbi:MAG: ABC transporter permease [Gemmatimonadaceae bacterium]
MILRRAWLQLRAVFGRRRLEDDMQAEMREHVDRAAERLVARGMSPADARTEARREFGNTTVIQDARDARGARLITELAGDLRFAFRYFARNKLTVAIIVSVFALGIGANTALVTAIQSQFQRPGPAVPDDGQVWILGRERATPTARWRYRTFSYAELRELAARRETFTHVAGWLAHDVVLNPADSIGPRGVRAHFVTPNYFATLGVGVVAGTSLTTAADDGADMSAVMSFAMAERLYGTPARAVGQRVLVNDVRVRVIGLAPPAFQGALRHMDRPALWIPVSARADIARVPPSWLTDHAVLEAFGRLAPDVSEKQAAATTQLVIARTLPDSAGRVGMARTALVISLHSMLPGDETREAILIFSLLGFVALLLLLVTCTNVSSLMVAAAVARRHEIAVRLSLGASRARLLRQLLTESTLLAVAGGVAGLTVFWWLLRLFSLHGTIDGDNVMPDLRTFAYTMAIAVGTGILFGLSPALHATRTGAGNALRDSGAGASRRSRLQRGFVVAQIVFSQPLLLMLGVTLSMVIAEYQPMHPELSQRVTKVTFRPLAQTGAPEHRRDAVDSLIPRIAAHPEVIGVVPEATWYLSRGFAAHDSVGPAAKGRSYTTLTVEGTAPGWFALLDVPILLGRDVSFADTASTDWPVVIGSDLARTLWGNAHPIGQTLESPGKADSIRMTVVGVYDSERATTRGTEQVRVFTAHGKEWRRDALLVRTRGAAEPFMGELRRVIRDRAPGLPVTGMRTIAQVDADERRATIAVSALVSAGGALALLLASLGLYGVIALAVRQRTREIGIRIALGARPVRVARMFLASGVRLGGVALLIGMPLSIVMLKLLLSQAELLAPKVNSWLIGAVVAVALLAVSAAATWVPARRASLVDPATTLRTE